VSPRRRDAAELAALVEQGLTRGLDVVDAFLDVTQGTKAGSSRALSREYRRSVQERERTLRRHTRKQVWWRSQTVAGVTVAGTTGVLAAVAAAPVLLVATGAGVVVAVRAQRKLRTAAPPELPVIAVPPPAPLPRSAIGAAEVARFTAVRLHLIQMCSAVEALSPGAGDELRRADAEAAEPLTALAERLGVLHHLQRELPNSTAATAARSSALVVRDRLASGCETYEALLAATAQLLAAPDTYRSTTQILDPAVDAMLAYAHGLQQAARTFDQD
jgi:hypothetical protein